MRSSAGSRVSRAGAALTLAAASARVERMAENCILKEFEVGVNKVCLDGRLSSWMCVKVDSDIVGKPPSLYT